MNKRGQVTIFAIIGIVLIVIIILFLFIRSKVYIGPATQQDLEVELVPIKEHVEECLLDKSEQRLKQLGLQGGYIKTPENTYRSYKDNRISYLCYNIEDRPYCRQRILRLSDMEQELAGILEEELITQCLNIQRFRKIGTGLQQGRLKLDVDVGEDSVLIKADFPVTISKGDAGAELKQFSANVEVPLGRLYNVARDILNAEAEAGDFDTTLYSYAKTQLTNKLYYVTKADQPYPDELYILTIKDFPRQEGSYIFQFFVQGEPR